MKALELEAWKPKNPKSDVFWKSAENDLPPFGKLYWMKILCFLVVFLAICYSTEIARESNMTASFLQRLVNCELR